MSTWKELCAAYEGEKSLPECEVQPKCLLVYLTEFDKLRAVVEAAESFNLCYRYCDKTDWIPTLNKMDEALKKLGVGE